MSTCAARDGIGTTLPLVVANMTAISGRRMAETVARRGGIAIIPQDIPTDVVAVGGRQGQGLAPGLRHPGVGDPAHHGRRGAVAAAQARARHWPSWSRTADRSGTVSEVEAAGVDRFAQVHEVMSSDLLTVPADTSPTEIFDLLDHSASRRRRWSSRDDRLVGVMTLKHALRSTLYRPALDADGRLLIGAAVGINGDVAGRAEALLDRRHRRAGRRHRARSPGEDAHVAQGGSRRPRPAWPRPAAAGCRWWPATWSPPTG